MQQNITNFIIDPQDIEDIFDTFVHKNPFSLKKEYKNFKKEYAALDDVMFLGLLSLEIQAAYKNAKQSNYIYHNKNQHKIAIIKFRIRDVKSHSGKSNGWRAIALVDEINNIFYLLSLYKHSNGKDNLTSQEKREVRDLCDEYSESIISKGEKHG